MILPDETVERSVKADVEFWQELSEVKFATGNGFTETVPVYVDVHPVEERMVSETVCDPEVA